MGSHHNTNLIFQGVASGFFEALMDKSKESEEAYIYPTKFKINIEFEFVVDNFGKRILFCFQLGSTV